MIRANHIITLALFLGLGASTAAAQQSAGEQRAHQALQSLPSTGQIITQQNMTSTVTPFVTATPPESTLTAPELDQETILRRFMPGAPQRAMNANEDSVLNRPPSGLSTSDLAVADNAVANANQTVGGYFDPANGGLCQYSDFGSVGTLKRLCDRYPSFDVNQCNIQRVVTVDRWDTWACEAQNPNFEQYCDRTPVLSCNASGSCEYDALDFTMPPNWVRLGNGTQPYLWSLFPPAGSCTTNDQTLTFDIQSDWQVRRVEIIGVGYSMYTQFHVNGTIIGTFPSGGTAGDLHYKTTSFFGLFRREGPAINNVYITNTCTTAAGMDPVNIDITPYLNFPNVTDLGGSDTATNTIRVISVGQNPWGSLQFRFQGPCCDNASLTMARTCAPVTR